MQQTPHDKTTKCHQERMIVKRNRLVDESAHEAGRLVQQEISSSNHFGQQQDMTFARMTQQDMAQPTSDFSANNDDNDEENIVIDMVDEDEDDDDDDQDDTEQNVVGRTRRAKHQNGPHHQSSDSQQAGYQDADSESRDANHQQQFNVDDLIWLDPNQLGYAIPGKVLDFYPDLNVLTVEGCCQPLALEDPQLDEQTRNRLLVKADEQLQVYELSSDLQSFRSIRFRKPIGSPTGLADLTQLEDLSNESIIWNLKLRFKQDLIYTKCGHKILISVNPYKQLSQLYNLDQVNQYDTIKSKPKLANLNYLAHNKFIRWLTLQGQQPTTHSKLNKLLSPQSRPSQPTSGSVAHEEDATASATTSGLAPHIFELANEALKRLLIQCQDQCFVLLGDSGSGKTETAKLLVQYFATVNKSPTNLMTEQILESIQILESFGNTKTLLNNNSSRFGKLLEIRFSLQNGFIQDARTVDLNLLDRSRIVCQNEGERNFNIFYELLAGLSKDEKEKYGLQTADKYFYLNQGHCVGLGQKDDGDDFRSLLGSMQVLGFTYEEQDTIFRVLATILHLGNIYFHRKVLAVRSGGIAGSRETHSTDKSTSDGGVEGVEIGSDTEARWVSHLLQVQFDLVMRCLTVRTVDVPGQQHQQQHDTSASTKRGPPAAPVDCIVTPLNIDQALDTRDAIARALYTCLFKWLVQRINLMINDNATAGLTKQQQQQQQQDQTTAEQDKDVDQLRAEDEPIYLCRTSESLCEFQPDKLVANRRPAGQSSRGQPHHKQLAMKHMQQQQQQRTALISILDAFGFENLTENNFEQLCINYAAELLHYHTNRYLIRLEQVEYARERIKWQPMTGSNYIDPTYEFRAGNANSSSKMHATTGSNGANSFSSNSSTLIKQHKQAAAIVNLISKKPLGILALLDDECNFPKATDQSFAEKCHHNHALNENYQCARLVANCQEFGVRHYKQSSRMVWYQVDGFIEKNRDSLRPDVMELLLGSKMTVVADMLRKIHKPFGSVSAFGGGGASNNSQSGEQSIYAPANNGKTLSRTYDGRYVTMKPRAGTVATRFQDSLSNNLVLDALSLGGGGASNRPDGSSQSGFLVNGNNNNYMTRSELSAHLAGIDSALSNQEPKRPPADVWFVVCLKPNRTKSAQIFDVAYVQEQVRSINLLELVHMRKFGFPVRLRYGDFLKRYKCLVTRKFLAASCGRHLKSNGRQLRSYLSQLDKSGPSSAEDTSRHARSSSPAAAKLPDRTNSIKRAMRNVCNSIIEFKLGQTLNLGPEVTTRPHHQCGLNKMFLSEWLFHQLEHLRLGQYQKSILIIQKTWKMWLVRREFLEQRRAATVIQAHLRGLLARKHFLEQCSLVVALQRRWRHLLHLRRAERLEARRRELKQRQRQQLLEWQAHQNKQTSSQLRFRLQAPTRATDKTLDIPEDLAQLYRLQRNWLPIHDLTNVKEFDLGELAQLERLRRRQQCRCLETSDHYKSPVGSGGVPFVVLGQVEQLGIDGSSLDDRIPSQVQQLLDRLELDERYSTYALVTRYFSSKTPQFGYSRMPITRPFSWPKMMHYKRTALRGARRLVATQPNTSPKEQSIKRRFMALEQKAVAVFKLILRYIDTDHQSFKLPSNNTDQFGELAQGHSDQVAQLMLQRLLKFKLISDYINYLCLIEPLLRDEVYLQLVSQTWQNPRVKSQENCWKLMLDCLACFEPLDLRLAKHLLVYASEQCCSPYKKMVCDRLFDACGRLSAAARRTGGPKRLALVAINSAPITNAQRQFPATILEYLANQQALDRLAISASCYMDAEHNNLPPEQSSVAADGRRTSCDGDNSVSGQLDRGEEANNNNDDGVRNRIELDQTRPDATNYSNRTVALVSSRSTAEQLAQQVLSCRGVPDANLTGWSVEIQHEGVLSEFSSRLRGDDHLFDHFARLELLPELVQLIDDDLEALECEQLDELGLNANQNQAEPDELDARLDADQLADSAVPSCCRNVSPPSDDCCRMSGVNSNYSNGYKRLSVQSQRSWDFAGHTRNDRALPGASMHHHELDPYQPDYYDRNRLQYNGEQHSNYMMMNMNRRSMSMQELQLAASSALNGRYFNMQQQAGQFQSTTNHNNRQPEHHYASSCLSSQCCGPASVCGDDGQLPRSRRHSGSLRQLNQSRQGAGMFMPATGGSSVQYQSRRRSTTPNSMLSTARLSASSAYGSHSSRFNAATVGSSGSQSTQAKQSSAYTSLASSVDGRQGRQHPPRHMQQDDHHQQRLARSRPGRASGQANNMAPLGGIGPPAWSHRSASSSSRNQTNANNKPPSDYASAYSDYEQVGAGQQGLAAGDLHKSRKSSALARRGPPVRVSLPGGDSGQQFASKSASVHYAATSSAMSDTSEAPSLASHVRGIKVPQPNGDLDQYLDDLFNPLLDGADLDELSDARSMATSIRGVDLGALCDPVKLSRLIRGTEDEPNVDNQQQQMATEGEGEERNNLQQQQRTSTLSPTFERLLKSLKGVDVDEANGAFTPQSQAGANLNELNLSQLKALNEKLESEIQAAQSARASLELTAAGASGTNVSVHSSSEAPPPVPPPQPSFGQPTSTAVQQAEQLVDDIYSRAKTIRIGKWRWPPALDGQQQQALGESSDSGAVQLPSGSEKKRASVLSSDLVVNEPGLVAGSTDGHDDENKVTNCSTDQVAFDANDNADQREEVSQQQKQTVPNVNASVGRLKISSEMKAKLEQLTNSGSSAAVPQEQSGAASQLSTSKMGIEEIEADHEVDQQPPRRLDNQRRNLLASQLLGARNSNRASIASEEDAGSRRDSGHSQLSSQTGSKVLAAKQQLAAAAGVALSALDSSHSGASSQTSSRRQSSCQPATSEHHRRLVLEADELGPQSRGAINQRQAFYLNEGNDSTVAPGLTKDGSTRTGPARLAATGGADQVPPPDSSGAKSLNLCLLKHKQEISQSKVGADQQQTTGNVDDNHRQRDDDDECMPAGQWVSSTCNGDITKVEPAKSQNRLHADKLRPPVANLTTNKRQQEATRKSRNVEQEQAAKRVACLSHANVDWQIRVRKEVFKPSESYDNELVVQLVFAQLVADVFNPRHWTRLNNKERAAIKSIMKDNSIGYAPSLPGLGQMQAIKRELVRMARSFGLYFTRSYQALNFACLSENYLLDCGGDSFDCDGDSLGCCDATTTSTDDEDSTSDQSDDSLFGDEHHREGSANRNGSRTPSGPKLALRLAYRMRAAERLGLEWIDMVAVHHSGLRLVALVCDQQQQVGAADRTSIRNSKQFIANQIGASPGGSGPPTPPIGYKVLETLKFRDMADVRLVSERVLLVSMRANSGSGAGQPKQARLNKSWLISSSQAQQLAALLENFLADYNDNVRTASTPAASTDLHNGGQKQPRKRPERNQNYQTSEQASEPNSSNQSRSKQQGDLASNSVALAKQQVAPTGPLTSKWRQNALLASDDVYDGDHLEQRQAPNSVDKLRPAAHPNNVLADAQRALPNDLANSHAPPAATDANSSGHFGPSKQGGSSGGARGHGAHNPQRPVLSASSSSPIPKRRSPSDSAGNKQPGQFRQSSSGSAGSSASESTGDKRRQPGGGLDAGRGHADHLSAATKTSTFSSNESLAEPEPEQHQQSAKTSGSNQLTSSSKRTSGATPAATSKQAGSTSMWQNSLSRMSNRFSLFGGVHLSAASTLKQQFAGAGKKAKKRPGGELAGRLTDGQLGAEGGDGQPSSVTLDAWIEAKVDFDGEEDELQDNQSEVESAQGSCEQRAALDHHNQERHETGSADPKLDPTKTTTKTALGNRQKQFGSLVAGTNSDEDNNNNNDDQARPKASKAEDGKYSMLQFALYNFREAIEKYSLETRLSVKNQNSDQSKGKQGSKPAPQDDWSTLRGSLKLIESLRSAGVSSHNSSSSQSTISSTKTLTRLAAAANDQQQQHRAEAQQTPADWTWRELAQMVKFTSTPLKRPLLKLTSSDDSASVVSSSSSLHELEKRAVDCFAAIMRYMGDKQPRPASNKPAAIVKPHPKQVPDNEVECVYLILINCHNHPELRDEIYCQLIKQTTNNRSAQPESCLRGWRLFSLLAAYFDCSAHFRPYLLNYLEQNAFDKRRSYHSIALLCLQNLRKTFKYGGRKNVPSIEEIAALSAGRISKRQIYRLPGGTERVINTKSTTVVDDIIHEICTNMLMINEPNEMLEFSLYCIADGDLYTMPLNRDEYILDITTELIKNHQQYFLIFCRSIWHYPLRLDSKLYIEVTFNQIAPDYLEGLLLVLPRQHHQQHRKRSSNGHYQTSTMANQTLNQPLRLANKLVKEIARLAALLHRASGTDYTPHKDEIKYLLPKPIVAAIKQQLKASGRSRADQQQQQVDGGSDLQLAHAQVAQTGELDHEQSAADSQLAPDQQTWATLVQNNWREMSAFDTLDAKAQFLDIIRHWPLFGSSFFAIKLIQRDLIQPIDYILALNKLGIQMLDTQTHETHQKYSFNEVISTRKVRSEDGALYLDMKCGNLMRRTIIRIQTDQAHEISRLVRQYIDIELLQASGKQQQASTQQQQQQLATGGRSSSSIAETDQDDGTNNNHDRA